MPTIASNHEKVFYEIQNALDTFQLTIATTKIPSVAAEGSAEYQELIELSGAKWIALEQQRLNERN